MQRGVFVLWSVLGSFIYLRWAGREEEARRDWLGLEVRGWAYINIAAVIVAAIGGDSSSEATTLSVLNARQTLFLQFVKRMLVLGRCVDADK